MKLIPSFAIALLALVASIVPGRAVAQYAYIPESGNPFLCENSQSYPASHLTTPIALSKGQKYIDAGRKISFMGLALALTGLTVSFCDASGYDPDTMEPGSGVGGMLALSGISLGAGMAIISVPLFLKGRQLSAANGESPILYEGDYSGFGRFVDIGFGFPTISVDGVFGHNFSNNFFVGAGAGIHLLYLDFTDERVYSLPIYANARYVWGDKRVSPYFSGSFGYDLAWSDRYTAFEFGTRVRSLKRERGASWFGFKYDYVGADVFTGISFKYGWSF